MSKPTPTNLKAYARLVFARSDVHAAQTAVETLMRSDIGLDNPLYLPLSTSAIVCYGRPFTENKGLGKLPEEWSEFKHRKLQGAHDRMIEYRHTRIAHTDGAHCQVSVISDPGHTSLDGQVGGGCAEVSGRETLAPTFLPTVRELCFDLGRRLNGEIDNMRSQLFSQLAEGEWAIVLKGAPGAGSGPVRLERTGPSPLPKLVRQVVERAKRPAQRGKGRSSRSRGSSRRR